MVGRSLPLTSLSAWEKYRLRWGADDGSEEFRMHICRARSFEKQDGTGAKRLRAVIAPRQ